MMRNGNDVPVPVDVDTSATTRAIHIRLPVAILERVDAVADALPGLIGGVSANRRTVIQPILEGSRTLEDFERLISGSAGPPTVKAAARAVVAEWRRSHMDVLDQVLHDRIAALAAALGIEV